MNIKKLLLVAVLIMVVSVAGCIEFQLDQTQSENEGLEPVLEPEPQPQSEPAAEEPIEPDVSALAQYKEYLQANYEPNFAEQASRMISLDITDGEATLLYETSTTNPKVESIYLQGVLFVVLPEIDYALVRGQNDLGESIPAASVSTTRIAYDFNQRYFTQEEIASASILECSSHADCDDRNPCTTDTCADNKCSHAQISECTHPGLKLLKSTNYKGAVSSQFLEDIRFQMPISYLHPSKFVLYTTGEIINRGDLKTEPNITVSFFDENENIVSTYYINTTPETIFADGIGTYELIIEDYQDLAFYSLEVKPKSS